MYTHPIVIVGGGPGGSTLAGLLAQRGQRPLVIERERFPRFHIGESLLPKSCEIFDKLGVTDALEQRFMKKLGATFICSQTGRVNRYLFSEAFDPRYNSAYQVPRAEFDHLLLERARELGAEIWQPCRVTDVLFDGERAVGARVRHEDDREEEVAAQLVVDASGRGSLMASRMRNKRRLPGLEQTAIFAHYRGVPRAEGAAGGDIRIIVFEHGWFWMIPFRGEITSVGAVVSRAWMNQRAKGESLDALFDRTQALSPYVAETMASAERIGPTRSAADFSYGVGQLVGDGWLCVGDSCGFIDPLFSSGAHLAIKGADLATDAILDALASGDTSKSAFAVYEQRMREASGMFLGAVQAFYEGELRELLFTGHQRRALRQVITSMLSGDVVHPVSNPPTWVRFVRSRFPSRSPGGSQRPTA